MKHLPLVIKIGGNDLFQPDFVPELAAVIAKLHTERAPILIHGGGRAIDNLMARLNFDSSYIDGQRVTDEATLEIAEMVLSGQINKMLVLALLEAGLDSIGISGVDRGLIRVEPWSKQMDRVGRIVEVRADILLEFCEQGVIPVISPISIGPEGRYNVNADHAAGAIAGAVKAPRVVFVSNVSGVQVSKKVVSTLSRTEAQKLIRQGVIHSGMIPKVNAALDALSQGAQEVIITDLRGLRAESGTKFVN